MTNLSINEEATSKNRKFKGVWIPAELYLCKELSWNEKILWLEIYYLSEHGDDGCFAGNDYFARLLGIGESTVSRLVNVLIAKGLLIDKFDGRKRFLIANTEPLIELQKKLNNFRLLNLSKQNTKFKEAAYLKQYANNKDTNIKDNNSIINNTKGKSEDFPTTNKNPQNNKRQTNSSKEYMIEGWKKLALQEWCKLPFVTKHKSLTTDILKSADASLCDLVKGTFGLKRHLENGMKIKKLQFTERQIIQAIKRYKYYLTDGYWPYNKKWLPLTLDKFLYNIRTNKSMFLTVANNGDLKPLSEQNRNKDYNPQYTEYFQKRGLLNQISEERLPAVYKGIEAIQKRLLTEWVFDFNDKAVVRDFGERRQGKLIGFFKQYAKHVAEEWNDQNPEQVFNPYGKHLKEFIKEYNIDRDWS